MVSGFQNFSGEDGDIFAKALVWAVDNVCPQLREGITSVDVATKSFACNLILAEPQGKDGRNTFYCKAAFRVAGGRLVYCISDISVESSILVVKRTMHLEKLAPEKKKGHQETMDGFVRAESILLNTLFDFVGTYVLSPVTHWKEISNRSPVVGMTADEVKMAMGKPLLVSESDGETQWNYGGSLYIFFRSGRVHSVLK